VTTDLEQKKPTAPARPRLQSGRHVDHNTGDMKGDDKTQVGGQNRTRINVHEDCEVRDWCQSLGVTQDELRKAVADVRNRADKVREHLGKTWWPPAMDCVLCGGSRGVARTTLTGLSEVTTEGGCDRGGAAAHCSCTRRRFSSWRPCSPALILSASSSGGSS
jgi:hypothetical protein